jgi:hypothetical protein
MVAAVLTSSLREASKPTRPSTSLRAFRWHTGASLRAVDVDEALPPLVRDVGPVALALFLRGGLARLAGPRTPLLYMRTQSFREPYVDHAGTGRLVFVRPRQAGVWHSGVVGVYVADAGVGVADVDVVYVPAGGAVPDDAADADAFVDDACAAAARARARDDLAALDALNAAAAAVDVDAAPLRRLLQAGRLDPADCAAVDVDEADLTAAYHHLPAARRDGLHDRVRALAARVAERR